MIEIISGQFAAGETKTYMVNGEYLEILDAQYPVDVYMMDKSGGQLSMMRNAEASFFSRPGAYGVVQITSANAQSIRIFIGSGDAGTRRISSTVKVIDGEAERTKAGGMYCGVPSAPAVAALFSTAQLWNPAGSGKNVILTQLMGVGGGVTLAASVYYGLAALATDQTAARAANKKGFGVIGVAQVRVEAIAQSGFSIYALGLPANSNALWPIRGGIVIPPGVGINLQAGIANANLGCNFEWYEEAI